MCILHVLPENTPEKIGQERAGTEWTVVKSKIRLCIRNRSYGRFLHGGILMGIALPIPLHRANHMILPVGGRVAAGHSRSADALPGKFKLLGFLERRPHATNKKKVKSIVKTK